MTYLSCPHQANSLKPHDLYLLGHLQNTISKELSAFRKDTDSSIAEKKKKKSSYKKGKNYYVFSAN